MSGADLVMGHVVDSTGIPGLFDYHGSNDGLGVLYPIKDEEQNYQLLGGGQNETHTMLKFKETLKHAIKMIGLLGTTLCDSFGRITRLT
jgi:hypothetical protein